MSKGESILESIKYYRDKKDINIFSKDILSQYEKHKNEIMEKIKAKLISYVFIGKNDQVTLKNSTDEQAVNFINFVCELEDPSDQISIDQFKAHLSEGPQKAAQNPPQKAAEVKKPNPAQNTQTHQNQTRTQQQQNSKQQTTANQKQTTQNHQQSQNQTQHQQNKPQANSNHNLQQPQQSQNQTQHQQNKPPTNYNQNPQQAQQNHDNKAPQQPQQLQPPRRVIKQQPPPAPVKPAVKEEEPEVLKPYKISEDGVMEITDKNFSKAFQDMLSDYLGIGSSSKIRYDKIIMKDKSKADK